MLKLNFGKIIKRGTAYLLLSVLLISVIPVLSVSADVYSDFNPGWPTAGAHRINALDKYSGGSTHSSGMDILPDVKGTNPEVRSIADNGVVVRVYNGCTKVGKIGHSGCPADKNNLTASGKYTTENSGGNEVGVVYTVGKNKYYVGYSHLKKDSIKVKRGDKIQKGTLIGLMGNSGSSSGTHLHLDIGYTTCGYWKKSELQNTFDYYINNPKNTEVLKTLKVNKKLVAVKSKYANVIKEKGTLEGDYYTFKNIKSPMIIEEGTYEIENAHHTGYVLDIKDGSAANKANVQIYKRNNTLAQQFQLKHMGNDYYQIISNKSKLALDAQSGGTKSGTNVWQYTNNKTDAQIWKITKNTDGTYRIANKKSGLLLQTAAGKSKNGINVNISGSNSQKSQAWKIKKVTTATVSSQTSQSAAKKSVTFTAPWVESVTKTSVKLKGKVSYSGTRPTEVSLLFGTNKNKLSVCATDKITFSKNPFNIWYTKSGLKAGTTYYYQVYAVVNGKKEYSEIKSFRTKK